MPRLFVVNRPCTLQALNPKPVLRPSPEFCSPSLAGKTNKLPAQRLSSPADASDSQEGLKIEEAQWTNEVTGEKREVTRSGCGGVLIWLCIGKGSSKLKAAALDLWPLAMTAQTTARLGFMGL